VKPSICYRIAAVLLVLFGLGHTVGFRQTPPEWGVGELVRSMQTIHFNVQGFDRTYYGFYVGFGLFVAVFLFFSALVAWQLGRVRPETLAAIPAVTWGLVACFLAVTVLSWRYFFVIPVVFSALITLCLAFGAWSARKTG